MEEDQHLGKGGQMNIGRLKTGEGLVTKSGSFFGGMTLLTKT